MSIPKFHKVPLSMSKCKYKDGRKRKVPGPDYEQNANGNRIKVRLSPRTNHQTDIDAIIRELNSNTDLTVKYLIPFKCLSCECNSERSLDDICLQDHLDSADVYPCANEQVDLSSYVEELVCKDSGTEATGKLIEESCFKLILQKLCTARRNLNPIIDEIINATSCCPDSEMNLPICSLSSEQYLAAMKASTVLHEVNSTLFQRISNDKHLKKDYMHFPRNMVVNLLSVLEVNEYEGPNEEDRIYIDRELMLQLIQLYELLGDTIQQLRDAEMKSEASRINTTGQFIKSNEQNDVISRRSIDTHTSNAVIPNTTNMSTQDSAIYIPTQFDEQPTEIQQSRKYTSETSHITFNSPQQSQMPIGSQSRVSRGPSTFDRTRSVVRENMCECTPTCECDCPCGQPDSCLTTQHPCRTDSALTPQRTEELKKPPSVIETPPVEAVKEPEKNLTCTLLDVKTKKKTKAPKDTQQLMQECLMDLTEVKACLQKATDDMKAGHDVLMKNKDKFNVCKIEGTSHLHVQFNDQTMVLKLDQGTLESIMAESGNTPNSDLSSLTFMKKEAKKPKKKKEPPPKKEEKKKKGSSCCGSRTSDDKKKDKKAKKGKEDKKDKKDEDQEECMEICKRWIEKCLRECMKNEGSPQDNAEQSRSDLNRKRNCCAKLMMRPPEMAPVNPQKSYMYQCDEELEESCFSNAPPGVSVTQGLSEGAFYPGTKSIMSHTPRRVSDLSANQYFDSSPSRMDAVNGEPLGIMGQPSGIRGQSSGITGQPSGITGQPSGLTGQPSGITGQPSGITGQPSGITGQPSGITGQPSGLTGQPSGMSGQPSVINGQPSMAYYPQAAPSAYGGPQGESRFFEPQYASSAIYDPQPSSVYGQKSQVNPSYSGKSATFAGVPSSNIQQPTEMYNTAASPVSNMNQSYSSRKVKSNTVITDDGNVNQSRTFIQSVSTVNQKAEPTNRSSTFVVSPSTVVAQVHHTPEPTNRSNTLVSPSAFVAQVNRKSEPQLSSPHCCNPACAHESCVRRGVTISSTRTSIESQNVRSLQPQVYPPPLNPAAEFSNSNGSILEKPESEDYEVREAMSEKLCKNTYLTSSSIGTDAQKPTTSDTDETVQTTSDENADTSPVQKIILHESATQTSLPKVDEEPHDQNVEPETSITSNVERENVVPKVVSPTISTVIEEEKPVSPKASKVSSLQNSTVNEEGKPVSPRGSKVSSLNQSLENGSKETQSVMQQTESHSKPRNKTRRLRKSAECRRRATFENENFKCDCGACCDCQSKDAAARLCKKPRGDKRCSNPTCECDDCSCEDTDESSLDNRKTHCLNPTCECDEDCTCDGSDELDSSNCSQKRQIQAYIVEESRKSVVRTVTKQGQADQSNTSKKTLGSKEHQGKRFSDEELNKLRTSQDFDKKYVSKENLAALSHFEEQGKPVSSSKRIVQETVEIDDGQKREVSNTVITEEEKVVEVGRKNPSVIYVEKSARERIYEQQQKDPMKCSDLGEKSCKCSKTDEDQCHTMTEANKDNCVCEPQKPKPSISSKQSMEAKSQIQETQSIVRETSGISEQKVQVVDNQTCTNPSIELNGRHISKESAEKMSQIYKNLCLCGREISEQSTGCYAPSVGMCDCCKCSEGMSLVEPDQSFQQPEQNFREPSRYFSQQSQEVIEEQYKAYGPVSQPMVPMQSTRTISAPQSGLSQQNDQFFSKYSMPPVQLSFGPQSRMIHEESEFVNTRSTAPFPSISRPISAVSQRGPPYESEPSIPRHMSTLSQGAHLYEADPTARESFAPVQPSASTVAPYFDEPSQNEVGFTDPIASVHPFTSTSTRFSKTAIHNQSGYVDPSYSPSRPGPYSKISFGKVSQRSIGAEEPQGYESRTYQSSRRAMSQIPEDGRVVSSEHIETLVEEVRSQPNFSGSEVDVPYAVSVGSMPKLRPREMVSPSLNFDLNTVHSQLRTDGIAYPDRNIQSRLENIGIENLLEASRPAKCCRKSILNESASQPNLPYPASLVSLPLDDNDVNVIEQTIQMSIKNNNRSTTYDVYNTKMEYYTNLVEDDFYRDPRKFPKIAPVYEVRYFEIVNTKTEGTGTGINKNQSSTNSSGAVKKGSPQSCSSRNVPNLNKATLLPWLASPYDMKFTRFFTKKPEIVSTAVGSSTIISRKPSYQDAGCYNCRMKSKCGSGSKDHHHRSNGSSKRKLSKSEVSKHEKNSRRSINTVSSEMELPKLQPNALEEPFCFSWVPFVASETSLPRDDNSKSNIPKTTILKDTSTDAIRPQSIGDGTVEVPHSISDECPTNDVVSEKSTQNFSNDDTFLTPQRYAESLKSSKGSETKIGKFTRSMKADNTRSVSTEFTLHPVQEIISAGKTEHSATCSESNSRRESNSTLAEIIQSDLNRYGLSLSDMNFVYNIKSKDSCKTSRSNSRKFSKADARQSYLGFPSFTYRKRSHSPKSFESLLRAITEESPNESTESGTSMRNSAHSDFRGKMNYGSKALVNKKISNKPSSMGSNIKLADTEKSESCQMYAPPCFSKESMNQTLRYHGMNVGEDHHYSSSCHRAKSSGCSLSGSFDSTKTSFSELKCRKSQQDKWVSFSELEGLLEECLSEKPLDLLSVSSPGEIGLCSGSTLCSDVNQDESVVRFDGDCTLHPKSYIVQVDSNLIRSGKELRKRTSQPDVEAGMEYERPRKHHYKSIGSDCHQVVRHGREELSYYPNASMSKGTSFINTNSVEVQTVNTNVQAEKQCQATLTKHCQNIGLQTCGICRNVSRYSQTSGNVQSQFHRESVCTGTRNDMNLVPKTAAIYKEMFLDVKLNNVCNIVCNNVSGSEEDSEEVKYCTCGHGNEDIRSLPEVDKITQCPITLPNLEPHQVTRSMYRSSTIKTDRGRQFLKQDNNIQTEATMDFSECELRERSLVEQIDDFCQSAPPQDKSLQKNDSFVLRLFPDESRNCLESTEEAYSHYIYPKEIKPRNKRELVSDEIRNVLLQRIECADRKAGSLRLKEQPVRNVCTDTQTACYRKKGENAVFYIYENEKAQKHSVATNSTLPCTRQASLNVGTCPEGVKKSGSSKRSFCRTAEGDGCDLGGHQSDTAYRLNLLEQTRRKFEFLQSLGNFEVPEVTHTIYVLTEQAPPRGSKANNKDCSCSKCGCAKKKPPKKLMEKYGFPRRGPPPPDEPVRRLSASSSNPKLDLAALDDVSVQTSNSKKLTQENNVSYASIPSGNAQEIKTDEDERPRFVHTCDVVSCDIPYARVKDSKTVVGHSLTPYEPEVVGNAYVPIANVPEKKSDDDIGERPRFVHTCDKQSCPIPYATAKDSKMMLGTSRALNVSPVDARSISKDPADKEDTSLSYHSAKEEQTSCNHPARNFNDDNSCGSCRGATQDEENQVNFDPLAEHANEPSASNNGPAKKRASPFRCCGQPLYDRNGFPMVGCGCANSLLNTPPSEEDSDLFIGPKEDSAVEEQRDDKVAANVVLPADGAHNGCGDPEVCWALTRVKIFADGTKEFDILDVSPVPPGHYLITDVNSVVLLGNQPNSAKSSS